MANAAEFGTRWGALAGEPEAAQASGMRSVLDEVVRLPEAERAEVIEAMVKAEYALDDAALHVFTANRLRTWLALSASDMEAAKTVVHGYDSAFEHLPGGMAMRRATMVQTVARTEMTPEEVAGLFELIPSIVRQVPRSAPSPKYTPAGGVAVKKKPAWKFWGK